MGKCCAVSGCLSGRKASENLGKVALFKAPKDVKMLSKWSSALGKELKNTSFVCELHFNPKDVIKSNQEILKDETILETQPLRKNWSWTVIKDSYILLSYINLILELVCHVKIYKNLKVTIENAKTNILIDKNVNISSIDCVWQLLSSLENSFFCSGTGYDEKKCSLLCTGVLLADERYKKQMKEYRCINCRKLRHLIQRRKNKTIDYKARWINVKNHLILELRKLNRVLQQNKSLKEELLKLQKQCAEIKGEILSEKIADLPALQQQTVRNCLIAAKAKGAKQRRYSVEWVNECLLMNAKSSSLYEYIRKKNILPLPCKDTLMRYVQNINNKKKIIIK
ncbi:PREDICTED: uncharacterized protein LOC107066462 isoform X2 [Polistes dominula]|uniref:Uncharacterized protein LOC107066462 isoform X2 n=1 Tax=Polistes dominula TaxID=743375 RepID=A0ABM1I8Q8_POLDO|nr:PREDICTED: uncharacterized protein LOC107066462 isoform X2 [Polistes dominula]